MILDYINEVLGKGIIWGKIYLHQIEFLASLY